MNSAIKYIGKMFDFPICPLNEEKLKSYLDRKLPEWLAILTEDGEEPFCSAVTQSAKIMQFLLEASSVKDVDGEWVNADGYKLDKKTGNWITQNGKSYSDSLSSALWTVLS